jgi:hypothetical protein
MTTTEAGEKAAGCQPGCETAPHGPGEPCQLRPVVRGDKSWWAEYRSPRGWLFAWMTERDGGYSEVEDTAIVLDEIGAMLARVPRQRLA